VKGSNCDSDFSVRKRKRGREKEEKKKEERRWDLS